MTPIRRLTNAYRNSVTTVREAIADAIEGLEQSNLGVLQHPMTELAMSLAAQSEDRIASGHERPLEGIPFGIKDIIDVAGIPTSFGSVTDSSMVASNTATVVQRLIDAGAIPVAKLRTYEFAAGPNQLTKNPFNAGRMSGGSSSGSAAAVGAGLLPFALGTDTGGSVRVPAAWCGAVGLKPTYGWISRHGVASLSWTLDHVGLIGASVEDVRLILEQLAGSDPCDVYSSSPASLPARGDGPTRIGVPRPWAGAVTQPAVESALVDACQRAVDAGFQVAEVDIDDIAEFNPDIIKHLLVASEAASLHESSGLEYGDKFLNVLEAGRRIAAIDYLKALRMRSKIQRSVGATFRECDYLLTTTCPITAPTVESERVTVGETDLPMGVVVARNTSLFNISGHPAVTVPYGRDDEGLPIGLQLVGPFWRDCELLDLAGFLES